MVALGSWILAGCSVQTAGRFRSMAQVGFIVSSIGLW